MLRPRGPFFEASKNDFLRFRGSFFEATPHAQFNLRKAIENEGCSSPAVSLFFVCSSFGTSQDSTVMLDNTQAACRCCAHHHVIARHESLRQDASKWSNWLPPRACGASTHITLTGHNTINTKRKKVCVYACMPVYASIIVYTHYCMRVYMHYCVVCARHCLCMHACMCFYVYVCFHVCVFP